MDVEHLAAQQSSLPRCVTFWCRHRRLGESISRCAEDLRGLASLCKFEAQSPQTVMFRLVAASQGSSSSSSWARPEHSSHSPPIRPVVGLLCSTTPSAHLSHRLSCYSLRRCLNGSLPGLLPSELPWFFLILSIIASRSMMQISLYTTFQMCSMGLRSGDCGGHRSPVKSLPGTMQHVIVFTSIYGGIQR